MTDEQLKHLIGAIAIAAQIELGAGADEEFAAQFKRVVRRAIDTRARPDFDAETLTTDAERALLVRVYDMLVRVYDMLI